MKKLLVVWLLLVGFGFSASGEYLADCLSGIHAQRNERWDEAILHYDVCIEYGDLSKKNLVNMHNRRGIVYERQGNYDRAIVDYNQALTIDPKYVQAYTNRGTVYSHKGDYDRAIADYNQALTINPQDAYTLTMRGDAYNKKKQYDQAIEDYNRALEFQEHAAIFHGRGKAYRNQKKYSQAIQDFKKALELSPNDTNVQKELDQVLLLNK